MKPKFNALSFRFHPVTTVGCSCIVALLVCTAGTSHAQTNGTWNSNSTGSWSDSTKWLNSLIADGVGSTANFSVDLTGGNKTVTLDSSRTVGSLTIGDTSTSDRRSFIITGSVVPGSILTFNNNGVNAILTQRSASNGDTISAPISLMDSLDITNSSASQTLTLSGGISAGSSGTKTISILGSTAGGVTISGGITAGSGDFAILKGTASNTLTLSGANTYTGGTTINGGLINVIGAGTLGVNSATNNVTVNAGGNLSLGNTAAIGNLQSINVSTDATALGGFGIGYVPASQAAIRTFANNRSGTDTGGVFGINTTGFNTVLDMNTLGGGGMLLGSQTSGTYSAASLAVQSVDNTYRLGGGGGALTISNAVLTGNANVLIGDLRTNGNGTVILSANNGYTGTTTINAASTLQLGSGSSVGNVSSTSSITNNGTLTFSRSDAFTFDKDVSGTGGIRKVLTNTVNLGGALTYTGTTNVVNGTLNFTGATTSLAGSVVVGQEAAGSAIMSFAAGSAVSLGSGSGNSLVIANGTTTSSTTTGTLDASAATSLTVNVGTVSIGASAGSTTYGIGILKLATTTNNITASTSFVVGNASSSPSNMNSIVLGAGQNTITTPIFTLGEQKSGGELTMDAGGTFTLKGSGAGTTALTIGRNSASGTGTTPVATADLTTGTFLGTLGAVIVGQKSGTGGTGNNGSATGTLKIGSSVGNVVTATSLRIGDLTSAATVGATQTATGTVDFGGGTFFNSGTTVLGANATTVDGNATGTLNITGGTATLTGTTTLGSSTASSGAGNGTGTLNVSGSTAVNAGAIVLGAKSGAGVGVSTGMLNLTGGSLTTSGNITDGTGTSSLILNGGSLNLGGNNIGSASQNIDTLTLASGTLQNVGQINGGGAITKTTGGTLTIAGTNTFTGPTTVSEGTLLVGGNVGSLASLGLTAVDVSSGATLGGHGIINGTTTINNGGILSAGSSAGSMEFASNLTITGATASTVIELGGTNFSMNMTEQYDRIKLTGATAVLTLGGTLDVSLIDSFALAANQVFGIFQLEPGASRSGTFANASTTGSSLGTVGAQELFISYEANFGDSGAIALTGGNDIAIYTIPEPSSALLLLGGLGMLIGFRRR